MTWGETIDRAAEFLGSKGVEDAHTAGELLAARLLRTSRGMLGGELGKEVPEKFLDAMRRGVSRLSKGEPVQYVIGEWDFRTLTLKCDRRALIPRPETEELVTRVLAWLSSESARTGRSNLVVADVGTGTGAIALSIVAEFGGAVVVGTDISEDAVALARENAEKCGLSGRVKFVVADGLADFDGRMSLDAVVSNPPYIETAVCDTLAPNVRDYEPRIALDGGESGLDFFDRYLGEALNVLRPGGAVFFEIGESQGEAVRELMFEYGYDQISVEKDFAGHDRYASAVIP